MPVINPYLNFQGNAEEAFNFYQSVFGGEYVGGITRFRDSPEADNISEEDKNKVMHIALPIGKGNILMASDSLESMDQRVIQGNNLYISIQTDSKEEADRLYDGLSAGGVIEMELQNTFWGDYFGMFTDKFGVKWMVSYNNSREV